MNSGKAKELKRAARLRGLNPDLVIAAYKKRKHQSRTPPKNAHRPTRRSYREISHAAIDRGLAEKKERAAMYLTHPELEKPWRPIQNLRRVA